MAWWRPFTMERGFEHDDPLTGKEAMRGHPTAPGPRDPFVNVVGADSDDGNGIPGLPRVIPTPMSHGPGIPRMPSGPMQPGVRYLGTDEDDA